MLSAAIVIGVFAVSAAACLYLAVRVFAAGRPAWRSILTSSPPDLALSFLLGRWEGAGIGGYPTIESFRFGQEISFSHNGKPFLIYTSRTWRLDEEGRSGRRWAPRAGTGGRSPDSQVEVMLAHPTGIVEIYLGEITGTRIEMATDVVARTATAKEVTAGQRGREPGGIAHGVRGQDGASRDRPVHRHPGPGLPIGLDPYAERQRQLGSDDSDLPVRRVHGGDSQRGGGGRVGTRRQPGGRGRDSHRIGERAAEQADTGDRAEGRHMLSQVGFAACAKGLMWSPCSDDTLPVPVLSSCRPFIDPRGLGRALS